MGQRTETRERIARLARWIAGRVAQVRCIEARRVAVWSPADLVASLGRRASEGSFQLVRLTSAGGLRSARSQVVHVWMGDLERAAAIRAARAAAWADGPRQDLLIELAPPGEEGRPAASSRDRSERALRAREAAVAGRVAHLIEDGRLEQAERVLASVVAEAAIRRVALSASTRGFLAATCFWQGRFADAAAAVRDSPPAEVAIEVWQAIIRWARGEVGSPIEAAWAFDRAGESGTGDLSLWWMLDALVEEANHLVRGEGSEEPRPATGRLHRVVLAVIDARRDGGRERLRAAAHEVRRLGADGALRWGLGREGMNLIHAIPALLHVVHDAEDEYGALVRGCEWVRRHAGAEGVAVTSDGGGRLVAFDGWSRTEAARAIHVCDGDGDRAVVDPSGAIVGAPVRYHGRTIGTVVARSATGCVETVQEAVMTLASLCAPALRARLDAIQARDASDQAIPELIGSSPRIAAVRESIVRAAATMFPVLIEGESGTGKELVARAVHRLSSRRDRRCAAVNCAALADELVEAELFGYVRGAFTGAVGLRVGLFEEASGGTLFLDEVGELSLRAQAKLLRAVQEKEIRRLGENAARPVDVRIVAATNRSLADAAAHGQFRSDLLFRLSVVRIDLPPLRERVEDVPRLAQIFWRRAMSESGKHAALSPDLLAALCRHGWPGNVRELQNVMAALSVVAPTRGRMTIRHLGRVLSPPGAHRAPAGVSLERARWLCERQTVAAALARHAGRRTQAARELGLSRQGLVKAIRRLGLARADGKAGVA